MNYFRKLVDATLTKEDVMELICMHARFSMECLIELSALRKKEKLYCFKVWKSKMNALSEKEQFHIKKIKHLKTLLP